MIGAVSDTYQDYSALMRYQRDATIQPIDKPVTIPEDIRPEIPVEKYMELQDSVREKLDDYQASKEEKEARTRRFIAGYAGIESKKTQFEILLEGMNSEDDVIDPSESSLMQTIATLRDIQKQNNIVEAYAAYQQWQNEK